MKPEVVINGRGISEDEIKCLRELVERMIKINDDVLKNEDDEQLRKKALKSNSKLIFINEAFVLSDEETALRIKYVKEGDMEDLIQINALIPERFVPHGFGTYIENLDPSEVEITKEALDIILEQPERSGLQGLEFGYGKNKMVAWGSASPEFFVPADCINVPKEAKEWIKKFKVIA